MWNFIYLQIVIFGEIIKMKFSVVVLALSLFTFTACKKDKVAAVPAPSMESGIYSGKYVAQDGTVDTRYQFRLFINQIDDTTYTVQQLDAGNLPSFRMNFGAVLGTGTTTKVKFRIPIQAVGSSTIVGDARVSNGYDGLYYAFDKSITFGIVFDNNSSKYIRFTGIKD